MDAYTVRDDDYRRQVVGLITDSLDPSKKFTQRDVEIAMRIYNDVVTNNLNINDQGAYGVGDERLIPVKALSRGIKILLYTKLFVKKFDADTGRAILVKNPEGSRVAFALLKERVELRLGDLQKILREPEIISHFGNVDRVIYRNKRRTMIEDVHPRIKRRGRPSASASKGPESA